MIKALVGATALSTLLPLYAIAQTTAQNRLSLEEVVVTAQRRVQSIQDIPISATAFTEDVILKSNITEAKDYLQLAPNISFAEGGQRGNRSIRVSIRGVSNVGLGELSAADSIGYYFDDVNIGFVASGIANPPLYDVERVEILRGPQGTYFGRNSMGGALSISSKKPDENLYAEISGKYARFDTWSIDGVINVPVTDKFFLRAVAAYEESNGIVKNINPTGAPNSGYENKYARLSARILPSDNLTVDLSVSYSDEDEGHDATVNSGVIDLDTKSIFGPGFVALSDGVGFYPNNQRLVNHDLLEYNRSEVLFLNGAITYEGDGFQIKSITGYLDSENSRAFDQDRTSSNILQRFNNYSATSFSQELRLQSSGDRILQWTFGGIYSKDKLRQFNSVQAAGSATHTDPITGVVSGPFLPPFFVEGYRINENNRLWNYESYAAFGEITFNATDQLSLIVGGRYTHDSIKFSVFDTVAQEKPVADAAGETSFNNFSPRAVLNYKFDQDILAYISASRGYKAGGVDVTRGIVTDFRPEKLWSYEAGVKTTFAEGRVRLNAAVFLLDWKDLQVQSNFLLDPNDISSSFEKTLNAAKARNKGFEIDMAALLTEGLQVSFGLGYLKGEFREFPDAVLRGNNRVDLSGKPLPNTPKWTLNGAVDYSVPVTDSLTSFIRGEWVHRSGGPGDLEAVASSELNLPVFPYMRPSYHVFNLRAGIQSERFDITGYVENIFKENYYTGTQDAFGLGGIRLRPNPRIWGLKATYKFGS